MINNDFISLLPALQKYLPSEVVEQMVGMQPMFEAIALEPKKIDLGTADAQPIFKYWAEPSNYTRFEYSDMNDWLYEVMGPASWGSSDVDRRWTGSNRKYWFKKESDRTMFVLKWS